MSPHQSKRLQVRALILCAGLGTLPLACTGSVSNEANNDAIKSDGGSGGQDNSGGGGSNAGTNSGSGGATSNKPMAIGTLPLSRLSRAEYTNTVRWLLRDEALTPVGDFAVEAGSASGFSRAAINVSSKDARDFRSASESLATRAATNVAGLTGCPGAEPTDACLNTFIRTFGRRAFRRPLSDAEVAEHLALKTDARKLGVDVAGSIGLIVESMLQSPYFLFKWELGSDKPERVGDVVALTKHQLASRLAFSLSGRAPDDALIAEVDSGKFSTSEDIERVATRLLGSRPTMAGVYQAFHREWLEMTKLDGIRKDVVKYPFWNAKMPADLSTEFDMLVSSVLVEGDGKLGTLLAAPYTFVNESVSKIYGMPGITGTNFRKVDLDPAQRKGLLMQAPFMALTGGESNSLAPRRGDRIWRRIFCGDIAPVPMNVPELPAIKAGQTNRQRFEDQHDNLSCARACHGVIDPPGFAFENFGGAGEYRRTDNGLPVNSTGKFETPEGEKLSFNDAVGFVDQLKGLPEVQRCVALHWFRYATGRKEEETESGEIDELSARFKKADLSIPTLIRALVQSRPFRFRAPSEGEVF